MMIIEEQPQNAEAKKPIYLQRVNQLYTDINHWLQDDPLVLENGEIDVIEALGHYQAPRLSIRSEGGEPLAAFEPTGASVLLAEGSIDVDGGVDRGFILYMLKNDPQTYFKIDMDGWYWFKERLDVKPHFLNDQTPLLQLITWVSDYEF